MYNNRERVTTIVKIVVNAVVLITLIVAVASCSRPAPTVEVTECAAAGSEYAMNGTVVEITELGEVSICDTNGNVWVVITGSGLRCDDEVVLTLMDNDTTEIEDDEVVSVYNVTTGSVIE